jgi:hypothetical protein
MALIIQNSSGTVADANAYESVLDFKAYWDVRGGTYDNYEDPEIEIAIVKATDFLDTRFSYFGVQLRYTQGTQFPRAEYEGSMDTFCLGAKSGIPRALKHACSILVMKILQKAGAPLLPDPTYAAAGQLIEKTVVVGPIETTQKYAKQENQNPEALPQYPEVELLLQNAGLLGSRQVTLKRG